MQTLIITALFFLAGFLIGIKYRKSKGGASPEKLTELRVGAKSALTARTQKRKDRIMALAKREGRITNDDVEDMFCISDSTARSYLNELEEKGELTQHGESGRGVYYTPN